MIVKNISKYPIVIVSKWHADAFGGPGVADCQYMILPGDKIDLSVVGLVPIELEFVMGPNDRLRADPEFHSES